MDKAIGNDIIDWNSAKNDDKKLRRRSLEKVLTAEEIEIILSAEQPLHQYWVMWSIKEAAYKAWQRKLNVKPIFNPKSFNIIRLQRKGDAFNSTVKKDDTEYKVNTDINSDSIYSYCNFSSLKHGIFSEKGYREFLYHLQCDGWYIKKNNNGIPYLKNSMSEVTEPISLSHDGRYYAINIAESFLL